MIGRVHSVESCGSVDGPGIRFVAFLQGCTFRCRYCHNPDTWEFKGGEEVHSDELFREMKSLKTYFKRSGGGVTISGGEPLMQPEFVQEIFQKCREADIHTALDTTGCVFTDKTRSLLQYTDLVLLDLKCIDPILHKSLTQAENNIFFNFIDYLQEIGKPFWVRYVLVPGWTDDPKLLEHSAEFLSKYQTLERVDVLPFHKLGEYKWKALGREFSLADTKEPDSEDLNRAADYFRKAGLQVFCA